MKRIQTIIFELLVENETGEKVPKKFATANQLLEKCEESKFDKPGSDRGSPSEGLNLKCVYSQQISDTAFNEMFCDARELADEIDIPANFELTQRRHTVRRTNVNFDYEARDDSIEDPTLKYKAEFIFSH
ncbi:uncharacterized protein TNCV_2595931 [Trichonephila clavipes]|nr:uncharacterized protein TNCV_2595931 [Trichonephila clavipes]